MGSQASRELGEGDIMRLRVTRLLSPICIADLREGRSENIFRTVSISIREQELEIGGSHITDMTDSFHRQIRLEKLDTFESDSQDVRELWAVRPHAIFVMMMYTLESRRTFRADLALCDLHEFLCLNVTDIHEGISEKVSGTISTSAFLLDVTVMKFFRVDSFPVGCSCWRISASNHGGQLYRYWHCGHSVLCSNVSRY